jgi:hypothetical protein
VTNAEGVSGTCMQFIPYYFHLRTPNTPYLFHNSFSLGLQTIAFAASALPEVSALQLNTRSRDEIVVYPNNVAGHKYGNWVMIRLHFEAIHNVIR